MNIEALTYASCALLIIRASYRLWRIGKSYPRRLWEIRLNIGFLMLGLFYVAVFTVLNNLPAYYFN